MNLISMIIKWYLIGIVPAFIITASLVIFLKTTGYSTLMIRQISNRPTVMEGVIYGALKSWLTVLILVIGVVRALIS